MTDFEEKRELFTGVQSGEISLEQLNEQGKKAYLSYGIDSGLIDKTKIDNEVLKKYNMSDTITYNGKEYRKISKSEQTPLLSKEQIKENNNALTNFGNVGLKYGVPTDKVASLVGSAYVGTASTLNNIATNLKAVTSNLTPQEALELKQATEKYHGITAARDYASTVAGDNTAMNFVNQVAEGVGGMIPSMLVGGTAKLGGKALGLGAKGISRLGQAGYLGTMGASVQGATANELLANGDAKSLWEAELKSLPYTIASIGVERLGGYGKEAISKIANNLVRTFGEEAYEEALEGVIDRALDIMIQQNKIKNQDINTTKEKLKHIFNLKTIGQEALLGGTTALALGGAAKLTNIGNKIAQADENYIFNQNVNEVLNRAKPLMETTDLAEQTKTKNVASQATKSKTPNIEVGGLGNLTTQLQAQNQGTDLAQMTQANVITEQDNKANKTIAKTGGILQSDFARQFKAQNETLYNALDNLSKKLSVGIEFGNTGIANGYYNATQNKIVLDMNAENPLGQVAMHELTHRMQTLAPKEFEKYKTFVKDTLSENMNNEVFSGLIQKYDNLYNQKENLKLDENALIEEVISDFNGIVFGNDTQFIEKLAQQDRTLAQKIIDTFKKIIADIKSSFTDTNTKLNIKGSEFNLMMSQINEAESRLNNLLNSIGQEQTAVSDDVKYSFSDTLSTELDKLLNDKNYREPVRLRDFTPKALVENGIKDLPMYENPSHIRKNILTENEAIEKGYKIGSRDHYHGLGKEIYIKAIDSLDNPRVVFKNNNTNDYLIITTQKDNMENTIIVPVEIETTTNSNNVSIDINRVKTVYGFNKDVKDIDLNEYIKQNINDNIFTKIYEQKKEQGTGFTAAASSYNNILPRTEENVKYSLKDSQGNELTKEQQEYFKDSKARDENGNLMVVYHGTNADFNVFDNSKNNFNEYASFKKFKDKKVFMFTNSEKVANTYRDTDYELSQVKKVYLDIKKPYIVDAEFQYNSYFIDNDGVPTSVNNLVEKVINNGDYDGIIIKNVGDLGAYGEDLTDGDQYANDYIVFNSNQIKNIDNLNPTDSDDIRYSLKDDLKGINEVDSEIDSINAELRAPKYRYTNSAKYIGYGKELKQAFGDSESTTYEKVHEVFDDEKIQTLEKENILERTVDGYVLLQNGKQRLNNYNNKLQKEKLIEKRDYYIDMKNEVLKMMDEVYVKKDTTRETESIKQYVAEEGRGKEVEKGFLSTASESPKLNFDNQYEVLMKRISDGSYQTKSNEDTKQESKLILENTEGNTKYEKLDNVYGKVKEGTFRNTGLESALLTEVIEGYQELGNNNKVLEVIDYLDDYARQQGRSIQYLAQWKALKGTNKALWVKKTIEKYNSTAEGKKNPIKFDQTDAENLNNYFATLDEVVKQETDKTRDTIVKELKKELLNRANFNNKLERQFAENSLDNLELTAQDLKEKLEQVAMAQIFGQANSSTMKKISTYQTMAHLINTSTYARNILSNESMKAIDDVAKKIGGFVTGNSILTTSISKEAKAEVKKSAKQKAQETALNIWLGIDGFEGTKYTNASAKTVTGVRPTFKNETLNSLEKVLGVELKVPDESMKTRVRETVKEQYRNAMGEEAYKQYENEINKIADEEALYITFQDETWASNLMKTLKTQANKLSTGSEEFGVGDLLIKYTQVPGNIVARGIEYSPLGVFKALRRIKTIHDMKLEGKFTDFEAAKLSADVGRMITGTSLLTLGAVLSQLGVLTSNKEEDEDLTNLLKDAGISNGRVNLSQVARIITGNSTEDVQQGDILTDLSWLQPIATVVNAGVTLYEDLTKNRQGKILPDILENFLDLPCNQSLSTIMQAYQYKDKDQSTLEALFYGTLQAGGDSLAGFIPSVVRQTANAFDPVSRNTYSNKKQGNPLTQLASQTIKKTAKNLPGVSKLVEPNIRPDGKEKVYFDGGLLLNALIQASPARLTKVDKIEGTDTIKEVLVKSDGESLAKTSNLPLRYAPNRTQYTKDDNGEYIPLTDKQKTKYMQAYSEYYKTNYVQYLGTLNPNATDKQKEIYAERMAKLNKYAKQYAERKALEK